MQSEFVNSINSHTSTRGARKRRNGNASTSDSRSGNDKRPGLTTRKADYKGGSPCFLFSSFFKSEKGTRGRGRNPRAFVLAAAETVRCRATRPAPGNFPLVRKVTKGTAGVPPALPPLSFGDDAFDGGIFRIVHSRNVPASVSAPQGAHMKQICKPFKLHTSPRGARKRR